MNPGDEDRLGQHEAISARVRQLMLERLYIEVPSSDTDLFGTGIIDSLGLVELLLGLKQDLGVEVEVETMDIERFSSIDGIADFVIESRERAA
jgi:acyl carrier protein